MRFEWPREKYNIPSLYLDVYTLTGAAQTYIKLSSYQITPMTHSGFTAYISFLGLP